MSCDHLQRSLILKCLLPNLPPPSLAPCLPLCSPSLSSTSHLSSLPPSSPTPNLPFSELSDYVPLTQTLVFAPAETEHTIAVEILDNNAVEMTERFFGQLAIPPGEQGVSLVEDTASVFIYDEDGEIGCLSPYSQTALFPDCPISDSEALECRGVVGFCCWKSR